MTRHIDAKASEDKSMTDDEVLRVIEAAYFAVPDNRGDLAEQLHHAEKYVAALQAERDALRDRCAKLEAAHRDDDMVVVPLFLYDEINATSAANASALEALRGQVAELMKFREGGLPTKGWLRDNDQSRRVLHELNELLAMKNSGEF